MLGFWHDLRPAACRVGLKGWFEGYPFTILQAITLSPEANILGAIFQRREKYCYVQWVLFYVFTEVWEQILSLFFKETIYENCLFIQSIFVSQQILKEF